MFRCLRPQVQPTTNHLSNQLSTWILVDEGILSCYPPRMLVRKPPVPWCNFPHHLGVGRARRRSGCHVWLCVLWDQYIIIQVGTSMSYKFLRYDAVNIRSIAASDSHTNSSIYKGTGMSYFWQYKNCIPKLALEISDLSLPATVLFPRLDNIYFRVCNSLTQICDLWFVTFGLVSISQVTKKFYVSQNNHIIHHNS